MDACAPASKFSNGDTSRPVVGPSTRAIDADVGAEYPGRAFGKFSKHFGPRIGPVPAPGTGAVPVPRRYDVRVRRLVTMTVAIAATVLAGAAAASADPRSGDAGFRPPHDSLRALAA